jgi:hypothetical protein
MNHRAVVSCRGPDRRSRRPGSASARSVRSGRTWRR